MKTRVINNKYAGNYTETWLEVNKDNVINGVLVSEWETVILYDGNFLEPFFNGTKWVDGATPEQIKENEKIQEQNKYLKRIEVGKNKYTKLCADFRIDKINGVITHEFHRLLENTLKPVRNEFVNGQFITALEVLESIGSEDITISIYDNIHASISEAIQDYYVN